MVEGGEWFSTTRRVFRREQVCSEVGEAHSGRPGMLSKQPKKPPLYTSSSRPQLPLDCFLDEQRLLFAIYGSSPSTTKHPGQGAIRAASCPAVDGKCLRRCLLLSVSMCL